MGSAREVGLGGVNLCGGQGRFLGPALGQGGAGLGGWWGGEVVEYGVELG
jgi:hypothetical protein